MTTKKRMITSGLYLVIDPSMEEKTLLHKLEIVLSEKVAAVQIWDNFNPGHHVHELIRSVVALAHASGVPVLINNRWELLQDTPLDGVHFDSIPKDFAAVKKAVGRPFIAGLTCTNDLSLVQWATREQFDYVSFCSVFPSATATSCELVTFDTIREAKRLSTLPIFLAGGIKPGNMDELAGLAYDGIAVISGVMSADDPRQSIKAYLEKLTPSRHEIKNY